MSSMAIKSTFGGGLGASAARSSGVVIGSRHPIARKTSLVMFMECDPKRNRRRDDARLYSDRPDWRELCTGRQDIASCDGEKDEEINATGIIAAEIGCIVSWASRPCSRYSAIFDRYADRIQQSPSDLRADRSHRCARTGLAGVPANATEYRCHG